MASTITFNGVSYSIPAVGDDGWGSDLSAYFIAIASGALQKTGGAFTLTAEANFGATYGLKSAYFKSQGTNPSSSGVMRLANAENISWRNAANNADLALSVDSSNNLQFNGANLLYAAAGLIVNADISPSAAIAYSKLNLASSIVNADVSGSAAIAYSKLNLATSILNADINAAAAIAYSKLNLATSIVNADISGSAAIAYSKLNLATSILNADINAAAAIALSKLAAVTASRALVSDGSGFVSASSVTGTELGYLSGVTSAIQTQLNARIANTLLTTTGDMMYASSANTPARLPVGSSGQVIKSVGGIPTWSTFSGGINYISSNPDAESDTSGWTTFADAAATSPADGTGGSPNSTWTRTTSSPLRGSGSFLYTHNSGASRQGEGVSFPFTLDIADKAKVMQISFDYIIASGTFVAGSSTADSDLTVWIYDVTNAALIPVSSYKLLSNSTSVPDKFVGNFQTASNSTSYRLIIYNGTTVNAAFTAMFDNFALGPSNYVYGTPITDWVSYTPTLRGGTNGLTFTNNTTTGKWRRVGDSVELDIYTTFTGTPATGTGDFRWTLPPGLVADTTKVTASGNNQTIGSMSYTDWGTNFKMAVIPQLSSTTEIGGMADGASASAVNLTSPITWTTNDNVKIVAQVPIVGWSSSVQMSDSYDGRKIVLNVGLTSSQAVATNAILKYDTVVEDSTAGYSTSTGLYTVSSQGTYRISAVSLSGANANMYVKISGTNRGILFTALTTSQGGGSISYPCNAGDTIGIYADNGGTFPAPGALGFSNRLTIEKVQAPTTISATELVAFMAEGASSSSIGSNTTIPFNTPALDTHGGWNTTNKDYAVPCSGVYKVFFQMRVTGAASINQYIDSIIQIDTVTKRENVKYVENTGVAGWEVNVSWQGFLNSGQKIRAVGDTNLTTPALTTGATHTFMEIFRIK